MSKTKILAKVGAEVAKHSRPILITTSIVAGGAAIIFAIVDTPKAQKAIKDYEEELFKSNEDAEVIFEKYYHKNKDGKPVLNFRYKFKACWKKYIRTGVAFGASAGASIASGIIDAKQIANLVAMCDMAKNAYESLDEGVKESVSEKKYQEIRELVGSKKLQSEEVQNADVLNAKRGPNEILYYDSLLGGKFYSTPENIDKAANKIDRTLRNEDILSIDEVQSIEEEIWNVSFGPRRMNHCLYFDSQQGEFFFTKCHSEMINGEPCCVIEYPYLPRWNKYEGKYHGTAF